MDSALLPIGTWVVYDPTGGCRPDRAITGVVHDHAPGAMIMQTRYPADVHDPNVNVRRATPENILHVLAPAPAPKFQAGDPVRRTHGGAGYTLRVTGQVRWNGDQDSGCFSHRLVSAADGSDTGWTSECYLEPETRKSQLREYATA